MTEYLDQNLPFLKTQDIQASRQTVAIVSIIGLVFAGVGWVEGMRSSQRAIWQLDQQPGNWLVRRLIDLGMLVGLALLLSLSLGAVTGCWRTAPGPGRAGRPREVSANVRAATRATLCVLGQVLSFLVNMWWRRRCWRRYPGCGCRRAGCCRRSCWWRSG